MEAFTLVFRTAGKDISVSASGNSNLLESAQLAGVAIDAPCGGNGSCGKCKVRLIEGALASEDASSSLSSDDVSGDWRLACKSTVTGSAVLELPSSALAWQGGLKVDNDVSEDDPAWQSFVQLLKSERLWSKGGGVVLALELASPTIDDATPDAERLSDALQEALASEAFLRGSADSPDSPNSPNLEGVSPAVCGVATQAHSGAEDDTVSIPLPLLRTLPEMLRSQNFALRCLFCDEGATRLVALAPQTSKGVPCGIACDMGTTSVSVMLVDLVEGKALAQASAGNAQIRYGADIINRIMQQAKPGGSKRLQKALIKETINPLIAAVCAKAKVSESCISHAVFAGNTTMSHLLLDISADSLRKEPYVPCFSSVQGLSAGELGIEIPSFAPVYLAPNVGSYVGGDVTAGLLASGLWLSEELQLFIDLGTNGELVFGNSEFMMTCACSAGPAFEGGGIGCGMRATEGAIEAATLDPCTFDPTLTIIGAGKPAGICGSGLIDLVSELFRLGALDGRGKFIATGRRLARDAHGTGSYTVSFADEASGGKAVILNEVDIENFIRAKGAIFSAICVMLDATGCALSDITSVLVAGGIGSGININKAISIGLLPDIERTKYCYLGNTSLMGARAMVQSERAREKAAKIAAGMTYLELSSEPGYMDAFIAACFLPHTNASLFPSATEPLSS